MAVQKINVSDKQARPLDHHSQGPTRMSNITIWEGKKQKEKSQMSIINQY